MGARQLGKDKVCGELGSRVLFKSGTNSEVIDISQSRTRRISDIFDIFQSIFYFYNLQEKGLKISDHKNVWNPFRSLNTTK